MIKVIYAWRDIVFVRKFYMKKHVSMCNKKLEKEKNKIKL